MSITLQRFVSGVRDAIHASPYYKLDFISYDALFYHFYCMTKHIILHQGQATLSEEEQHIVQYYALFSLTYKRKMGSKSASESISYTNTPPPLILTDFSHIWQTDLRCLFFFFFFFFFSAPQQSVPGMGLDNLMGRIQF